MCRGGFPSSGRTGRELHCGSLGGPVDTIDAQKGDLLKIFPATAGRAEGAPLCLDLFAGAGGLAVGYRDAGWAVIGGNDIDADAGATFRLNFPEAVFFEGPITALSADTVLRECDIAE